MIAPAFKRRLVETSRRVLRTPILARGACRRAGARVAAGSWLAALFLASVVDAAPTPPVTEHYLQYGVGLVTETVLSPGGVCPSNSRTPCILGSGLGLALRAGYRARGPWYLGGAYEFSRQDPSNLLRLAILQQLRGEARYYLLEGTRLAPYLGAAVGGVLYGNEWGAETGGLTGYLGAGFEFEVSPSTVVGAAVGYRAILFHRWRDSAGELRANDAFGFGVAHMIGGALVFEVRDPLSRW